MSERLVCGNCGCHYRRVSWSIHGRREVVWRCINRLEFDRLLFLSGAEESEFLDRKIKKISDDIAQLRQKKE
ncbi:MAG: hypothetical protein HFJ84_10055 [Clostridiales bacterium]|nr:hypothetical protein [Clostridiales bacterium]